MAINIFYLYAIIYISHNIYHLLTSKPFLVTNGAFVFHIMNGSWILVGCFTADERVLFFLIAIFNSLIPIIRNKLNEQDALRMTKANCIMRIIMTLTALYWHFNSILWL